VKNQTVVANKSNNLHNIVKGALVPTQIYEKIKTQNQLSKVSEKQGTFFVKASPHKEIKV